jgi:hypothetical protein
METYQQIHDFTAAGAASFAAFLAEAARPDVNPEAVRLECLGVIEDNLNGQGIAALSWELGALNSKDGKRHTFSAELDHLIIETVTPEDGE